MTQTGIDFEKRKIHDPIHKTIGLSELEIEIINSRAFQRLRNIKQLGLINYVFPGADYTRFSHSIGVCHLTGKIFDAIHEKKTGGINDREKQIARLAGLLHDIGHYPFSHAMEDAIKAHVSDDAGEMSGLVKKDTPANGDPYTPPEKYYNHESIGREIISRDREIKSILDNFDIEPKIEPLEVYQLFTRASDVPLPDANMISSDLDADRLDYLLRSAYHIGLPYGSTDLDYILRQIKIDNEEKICISPKALRTIDHFLLCRYFDYSQVIFHKTVAGFEEVLKSVIQYLISKNPICYSPDAIITAIETGKWYEFDDTYILNLINKHVKAEETPIEIKTLLKSIKERNPPKEILKLEYIDDTNDRQLNEYRGRISDFHHIKNTISDEFKIPKEYIFIWDNGGLEITKIGKTVEISKSQHMSEEEIDKLNQSVRIFDRITKKSVPIMERNDSLMFILSGKALYSIRIFILFPNKPTEDDINRIKSFVKDRLPHRDWK